MKLRLMLFGLLVVAACSDTATEPQNIRRESSHAPKAATPIFNVQDYFGDHNRGRVDSLLNVLASDPKTRAFAQRQIRLLKVVRGQPQQTAKEKLPAILHFLRTEYARTNSPSTGMPDVSVAAEPYPDDPCLAYMACPVDDEDEASYCASAGDCYDATLDPALFEAAIGSMWDDFNNSTADDYTTMQRATILDPGAVTAFFSEETDRCALERSGRNATAGWFAYYAGKTIFMAAILKSPKGAVQALERAAIGLSGAVYAFRVWQSCMREDQSEM